MPQCVTCGNYDKAFTITMKGETHAFDSFECAIHKLAPRCEHCGCPILGHGVEGKSGIYCCAHCAEKEGLTDVKDRA